jgi:hypothetical protein
MNILGAQLVLIKIQDQEVTRHVVCDKTKTRYSFFSYFCTIVSYPESSGLSSGAGCAAERGSALRIARASGTWCFDLT